MKFFFCETQSTVVLRCDCHLSLCYCRLPFVVNAFRTTGLRNFCSIADILISLKWWPLVLGFWDRTRCWIIFHLYAAVFLISWEVYFQNRFWELIEPITVSGFVKFEGVNEIYLGWSFYVKKYSKTWTTLIISQFL